MKTELALLAELHQDAQRQGPGSEEATRLALSLTRLSPDAPLRVADIGCGTGASTLVLAQALPRASILALDFLPSFLQRLGERAQALGVEPEQAAQALEASQPALSLTESSEDGGGQTDVAVDSGEDAALERLSLRQAVQELAPRDRNIVYLRYCKSSTQTETARRLGMTQVQVSRREKVILQQLRLKLAE